MPCPARKSHGQPYLPRSKISCSAYCAALEKTHGQPTVPRSKNHTFSLMRARPRLRRPSRVPLNLTLSRLRRPSRVPADSYAFPPALPSRVPLTPHAFPLAPDRFSFLNDLFLPYQNWPHIRTLSRRLYDRVCITTQRGFLTAQPQNSYTTKQLYN